MGLWGEEKVLHATEGITALHVGGLLWGTLLHPNRCGMRVEAVHDGLNEGRTAMVSRSPQGFLRGVIDRKRVSTIHKHPRKAIGARFLVDRDRGLHCQRRGDGDPIVVTEEDERNVVNRCEVGG